MQLEQFEEEHLARVITNYNKTPISALGGRTPKEYFTDLGTHHHSGPRQADPVPLEQQ